MKRYLVFVIAFPSAALFIRLGIWQLDRLSARRVVNTDLAAHLAAAPVDLSAASTGSLATDSLRFRRAIGRGVFDFEREVVVMVRSYRGIPGVHVVTPLVMPLGRAVLVERGWVAAPDGKTVELAELRENDSAVVQGVLLEMTLGSMGDAVAESWPAYVRTPDPSALQPRYPYSLVRFVLRRTTMPEPAPSVLRAVPLPELSDGPHLSYAIQWFAFAAIAIVGSVALYRSSRGDGGGR